MNREIYFYYRLEITRKDQYAETAKKLKIRQPEEDIS